MAKKAAAKATTKKPAAKKTAAKTKAKATTAAKKPAAKKTTTTAKKAAPAKKTTAKKAPAKKAPVKKAAAAKAAPKKATAKKTAAKKTEKPKAAPKKTADTAKADAIKAAAQKVAAMRPKGEAPQKVVPKAPAHIKAKIAAKARARDKAVANSNEPLVFVVDQSIVYPAHGVGKITAIEKQNVAGMELEFYVVSFDQDKMVLRVPTNRAEASGMRALAGSQLVENALKTLTGKARIKRTMWSRRAQEYEAKINSGSLISIAEVVRDLHRGEDQPEQSYSERQLYESALDRMARELSAVENIDHAAAMNRLAESLAKKKPVAA